jgi:hypothetical protein
MNLKHCEANLLQDLKAYETSLLEQLKQEILEEIVNSPNELITYFKQDDLSSITLKTTSLLKDYTERTNALTKALTKIGMTEEEYFRKFDKHANISTN